MIDLKTLKQLVKLMTDNDLTELDIEGDQDKVRLRRRGETPEVHYVSPAAAAPGPAAPAPVAPAAPVTAEPAQPAATEGTASGGVAIKSPMVGTFYSAASPDAKPYASVGDKVSPDTVVCLIEAMKVFNEIKAEASGTITRVLVENGQAVEFDQPLFEIKPD
ncbi:acetyl-CoA carboxylase biotin carboxyl carrier protein [Phycisphaerales bacterium AB-hyl4]|uniref:Biotin carboxyl carrier protein of acetyl-CoA carboxylase n=1 Tax=Natronomicrosphaera hydrolytica TaxID=3242702 RepID=A0ABV4U3V7_9BACT